MDWNCINEAKQEIGDKFLIKNEPVFDSLKLFGFHEHKMEVLHKDSIDKMVRINFYLFLHLK